MLTSMQENLKDEVRKSQIICDKSEGDSSYIRTDAPQQLFVPSYPILSLLLSDYSWLTDWLMDGRKKMPDGQNGTAG